VIDIREDGEPLDGRKGMAAVDVGPYLETALGVDAHGAFQESPVMRRDEDGRAIEAQTLRERLHDEFHEVLEGDVQPHPLHHLMEHIEFCRSRNFSCWSFCSAVGRLGFLVVGLVKGHLRDADSMHLDNRALAKKSRVKAIKKVHLGFSGKPSVGNFLACHSESCGVRWMASEPLATNSNPPTLDSGPRPNVLASGIKPSPACGRGNNRPNRPCIHIPRPFMGEGSRVRAVR
jgi:hypothetical protein